MSSHEFLHHSTIFYGFTSMGQKSSKKRAYIYSPYEKIMQSYQIYFKRINMVSCHIKQARQYSI